MILRILLVLSLAVAMVAARGPADTLHDGDGETTAALVLADVDTHRAVVLEAAPPGVPRELVKAVASTEIAPSCPDLSRVFRPPRPSCS